MRCSRRKLKCDRKYPTCSRCDLEGSSCEYATTGREISTEDSRGTTSIPITTPSSSIGHDGNGPVLLESKDQAGPSTSASESATKSLEAVPGSDSENTSKPLDPCLAHACRILRTFPRMLGTCDRLPPFIHKSQISSTSPPKPLANCLALCRMWTSNSSMAAAGDFVKSSIKTEMKKLLEEVC